MIKMANSGNVDGAKTGSNRYNEAFPMPIISKSTEKEPTNIAERYSIKALLA